MGARARSEGKPAGAITRRQQQVLEIIKAKGPIARRHLAEMLEVKPSTMTEHLDALRLMGCARPSGRGRNTTWTAVQKPVADIFSMAAAMGVS